MTSSSPTYFLPEPSSPLIGAKPILLKQSPSTIVHPVQHPSQLSFHHPSIPSNPHQQIVKSISNSDTLRSLAAMNTNNGTSLLTTNNKNPNHNTSSLSSSVLTTNNTNDIGNGLNGHSLSQSMESVNNIGLQDDEVG